MPKPIGPTQGPSNGGPTEGPAEKPTQRLFKKAMDAIPNSAELPAMGKPDPQAAKSARKKINASLSQTPEIDARVRKGAETLLRVL